VYAGVAPMSLNPWLGPPADTLVLFGATWAPLIVAGQIWRVLTSMFLSVGLLQFAFLGVMRVFVAIPLERHVGSVRIAFVYLLSGIGGSLSSAAFLGTTIESGASPSVCGLLAIYALDLCRLRREGGREGESVCE
jgi:membrane associated rhomboid family serine protease